MTNRERIRNDRQLPYRMAITSILLVLGLLATAFVSNLLWETCADRVISQHTSPDGKWVATLLQRSCKVPDRTAYHLLLLPSGRKPRFNKQNVVFSCKELQQHRIRWNGPGEVQVELKCDRVYRQEREKNGISVSYTLEQPPSSIK